MILRQHMGPRRGKTAFRVASCIKSVCRKFLERVSIATMSSGVDFSSTGADFHRISSVFATFHMAVLEREKIDFL